MIVRHVTATLCRRQRRRMKTRLSIWASYLNPLCTMQTRMNTQRTPHPLPNTRTKVPVSGSITQLSATYQQEAS